MDLFALLRPSTGWVGIVRHNLLSGWNAANEGLQDHLGTSGRQASVLARFDNKLFVLYTGTGDVTALYQLGSDGVLTLLDTVAMPNDGSQLTNFIAYRGNFFGLRVAPGGVQAALLVWNTIALNEYAAGLYNDRSAGNGNYWHKCLSGRLEAFRESLVWGQYGWGCTNNAGGEEFPNFLWRLDPQPGGTIVKTKLLGGPDGTNGTILDVPEGTAKGYDELVLETHVGFGQWRGDLYIVCMDGGVRQVDPDTGAVTETPILSFQDHASMQASGLVAGDSWASGLILPSTTDTEVLTEFALGAEVTCNGLTGVVVGVDDAPPTGKYGLYLRDRTTKALLGSFPAGALYSCKLGLGLNPDLYSSAGVYGQRVHAWIFEFAGSLFALLVGGTTRNSIAAEFPVASHLPTLLARWDGATVSWLQVTIDDIDPRAAAAAIKVDEDIGKLHFWYADNQDTSYSQFVLRHVIIDLVSMNIESTDVVNGGVYQINDAASGPVSVGEVELYGFGRPGVRIAGVTHNPVPNTSTITYYLYDDSSRDAMIEVESDMGNGWAPCTRKAGEGDDIVNLSTLPTGTTHTFVHDLSADGVLYSQIQYRITVTTQI